MYLKQMGHFIIPQQLPINVVSGSLCVYPPHLTINIAQKQTARVCFVCTATCVDVEVSAAGKMIAVHVVSTPKRRLCSDHCVD